MKSLHLLHTLSLNLVLTLSYESKFFKTTFIWHAWQKSELDKTLQSRLPSHMVPEFVLTIPSFVLTTNGKVDTKALPLPSESDRLKETVGFTPPQTPLEVDLCEISSQVLKTKLGTSHNFFESGGTSMTAIACLQKILQKCNVVVSVQDFYNNPTVSQLAVLIRNLNPVCMN